MKKLITTASLCLVTSRFAQKLEGLAMTPPMGWNSWNTFETNINKNLIIKETADALVRSDMLEVGNPGLTLEESRAYFSLTCILAAPLMGATMSAQC